LWSGEDLLAPLQLVLPADRARLLVSMTNEQVSNLQLDADMAKQLHQNLEELHRNGWTVDLLVGDASLVLSPGRGRLLHLLRRMAVFAFDGINLDLERSDLPQDLQAQWWPLTLKTLQAVHAASALPITLTTHYRELEQASLQADLQQAGVASVMAMVYVRDGSATTQIARRILSRQAPLPITIVQSVEAQLPASESGFSTGRKASLERWKTITQSLSAMPNFLGIAVQSLENFNGRPPGKSDSMPPPPWPTSRTGFPCATRRRSASCRAGAGTCCCWWSASPCCTWWRAYSSAYGGTPVPALSPCRRAP
jgi:hypothetical protein